MLVIEVRVRERVAIELRLRSEAHTTYTRCWEIMHGRSRDTASSMLHSVVLM